MKTVSLFIFYLIFFLDFFSGFFHDGLFSSWIIFWNGFKSNGSIRSNNIVQLTCKLKSFLICLSPPKKSQTESFELSRKLKVYRSRDLRTRSWPSSKSPTRFVQVRTSVDRDDPLTVEQSPIGRKLKWLKIVSYIQ